MAVCKSCKTPNRDAARYCCRCGADMPTVTTNRCICGAAYGPTSRFCGVCGTPVTHATPSAVYGGPSRQESELAPALRDLRDAASSAAATGTKRLAEGLRGLQASPKRQERAAGTGFDKRSEASVVAHIGTGLMALSLFLPWIDVGIFGRATYLQIIEFTIKAFNGASSFLGGSDKGQAFLLLVLMLAPLIVVVDAALASLTPGKGNHKVAGTIGIVWVVAIFLYLSNISDWIPVTSLLGGGMMLFLLGSIIAVVGG